MSDYTSIISIKKNAPKLYDCLVSEQHIENRSSIKVELENDILKIIIECSDAVAFRATSNSVARLISVFESAGDDNE